MNGQFGLLTKTKGNNNITWNIYEILRNDAITKGRNSTNNNSIMLFIIFQLKKK